MNRAKTFSIGGIHPPKFKLSSNASITDAGIPEFVNIPIKQHIGNPAKILVQKGDIVKVGTLLADSDGIVSSDVHSSVSGEITKIEETEAESGYWEVMITIKTEGDVWEKSIDRSPEIIREIPFSPEEIVQKIRSCGIVGMGGAGYPTPIKTSIPKGKKADYLILNGIECEPFLTADERIMIEHAEEIIIGAKIINKALGIQNAIIGIDENKPLAIKTLENLTKRYVGVNIQILKTKYPQGAEKQLIEAITKREVPSGKLPIDVGCIVQNVGTVFAIYEAVMKNKPLIERITTVSGSKSSSPSNYRVRVGTPISFLVDKTCQTPDTVGKIITGGPMMGKSAINLSAPVTKLTSGIILMNEQEAFKPAETSCIRCAKCLEVCPIGLQPFAISKYVLEQDYTEMKNLSVMDCIECGSCSYICPAKLPLLDCCKLGKIELRKQNT